MRRRTNTSAMHDAIPGSEPTSRRSIIVLGAGAVSASLAGCIDFSGNGGEPSDTNSPVQEITFEADTMVVHLAEGHGVSELNLIDPDGSLFAKSQVEEGVTRVQFTILSITPEETYTAGSYELVAVAGDTEHTTTVDLRPSVDVVDVTPQRTEDDQYTTGKLLVELQNTGTGPTWVYNIGYEGAPYENAPKPLPSVSSTTYESPTGYENEILLPGETTTYIKQRGVIIVDDNDSVSCEGDRLTLTVVVQTLHGDVRQQIEASLSGGYHVTDPGGIQHPCKNVSIEMVGEGG